MNGEHNYSPSPPYQVRGRLCPFPQGARGYGLPRSRASRNLLIESGEEKRHYASNNIQGHTITYLYAFAGGTLAQAAQRPFVGANSYNL
jgi:hypothetical protein